MRVGIDLRALQTGHKFRGIGEVTKQITDEIISKLSVSLPSAHFVFFEYEGDDPKLMLNIPKSLAYEVIKQGNMKEGLASRTKKEKVRDNYRELYGSPVIGSKTVDVFVQFDYAFGVPSDTKTILVKHDLIPVIFRSQFFESPWVHFRHYAARTTLRTMFHNYKYEQVLRRSLGAAWRIIAVSNNTKKDLIHHFKVNSKKVLVSHLGVDVKPSKTTGHVDTGRLPTKPYLLFIGAGDARRRVDDLIAAYNNLKAKGEDIQLVLVGENFPNHNDIPNKQTREAVQHSSYGSDILTLGYVDDETKQQLYKGAIAFVYPTLYEGFGIPVLESMIFECPVITYANSSIPEVAGDYALMAKNWADIETFTKELLAMKADDRKELVIRAKEHAKSYTWKKSAKPYIQLIEELASK